MWFSRALWVPWWKSVRSSASGRKRPFEIFLLYQYIHLPSSYQWLLTHHTLFLCAKYKRYSSQFSLQRSRGLNFSSVRPERRVFARCMNNFSACHLYALNPNIIFCICLFLTCYKVSSLLNRWISGKNM